MPMPTEQRVSARRCWALAGFILFFIGAHSFAKDEKAGTIEPPRLVRSITTLKEGGTRLDWLGKRIAFDMLTGDYAALYTMRDDGTDVRCLSCNHPDLPRKNIGQPAWHPSGRYLAFQAEKQEHPKVRFDLVVTPGAGVMNDLWLLDLETNLAVIIREVENRHGQGILHAHFSADGRRLSWSEMHEKGGFKKGSEFGFWTLMVADFSIEDGKPALGNIRSYEPGGTAFYENHGFSPDGSRLIFSSNFEAEKRIESHIYSMDLQTGKLSRLTTEKYNEHALYSPDGRHIAWMSSAGNRRGGTDYWIMKSDGSGKRRLTFFNDKGHPHYAGGKVIVADLSWRPDGKAFAGYYRDGGPLESKDKPTRIVLIELMPEALE
jgi:Tol biopolymer transport system component